MHLKILIGVLTLGLASASPKAKPAAKASPQDYSAGQPIYFSVGANGFGQSYASQPFPGQYPSGPYNVRFASNYGYPSGNPIGVPLYPQTLAGNYYQQSQQIPGPVTYSNPSGNVVQSANYYGRLWPKNLVSPTGSPSPISVSSQPIYYPSSTPSPVAFSSTGNYGNPSFVSNIQSPVPTPPFVQAKYPQPIPVPVKVGSRNSFQSQVTNYNTAPYNSFVPASSPAPYLASYQQQSIPTPVQSYQQSTIAPYAAYQQQVSSAPYVAQYQQPSAASYQTNYQQQSLPAPYQINSYQQQQTPAPVQVNYQQQPTPAPVQVNYPQQPTLAPFQVNYQQKPTPAPVQVNYQQQPTPAPFQVNYQSTPSPFQVSYQQSTPASYGASYQQSTVSPFAAYQQGPTVSPYPQYQQSTGASAYVGNYQQPTASPFLASYQNIPVPVAYPQNQIQPQPSKPSLIPVSNAPSYPGVPATYEPVVVQTTLTSTPAPQPLSITENTFVPVASTPSPTSKPLATIIKSEYNAGNVSPQYNHIPSQSTASQGYAGAYHANAYLPQAVNSLHGHPGYSPSTAVSHVSVNGLGASYNY